MIVMIRRKSATLSPRLVALVVALGLAFGIPFLSVAVLRFVGRFAALPPPSTWQWLYLHHGAQFVFTLVAIALVRRFVRADYGLHLPPGKSYVGVALVGGAGFSLIACAVAYGPSLLAHTSPSLGYAPTISNVIGWLTDRAASMSAPRRRRSSAPSWSPTSRRPSLDVSNSWAADSVLGVSWRQQYSGYPTGTTGCYRFPWRLANRSTRSLSAFSTHIALRSPAVL